VKKSYLQCWFKSRPGPTGKAPRKLWSPAASAGRMGRRPHSVLGILAIVAVILEL
jgi:hypothetical protein